MRLDNVVITSISGKKPCAGWHMLCEISVTKLIHLTQINYENYQS
jgi:hypothetical protein